MDDYVGAKVTLNDMPLYGVDENGCAWTVSSLDGVWDGVGSSHEHSALAWGDGWVSNRSFLGGREITITGKVQSPSDDAYLAARQSLLAAIPADAGDLTVTVAGRTFLYRVQRSEARPLMKQLAGLRVVEFSIPLVSKSPYAFEAGDPVSGTTGLPSSTGGLRLPAAFLGAVSPTPPSGEGDDFGSNILDDPGITGSTAWSWNGLGMGQVSGSTFNHLRLRPGKGWNRLSNTAAVSLSAGAKVKLSVRLKGDGLDPNTEIYMGITDMAGSGDERAVGRVSGDSWQDFEVTCTTPSAAVWRFGFTMNAPAGGDSGVLLMAMPSMTVSGSSLNVPDGWVFAESTVSGEVELINPGSAPSPVVLRVDGPVSGPRIEHDPSGSVLELSSSIGSGHYVVFDSESRQVLVDGRDPARGAVIRRGWSDALPGPNVWRFAARDTFAGARLSVSFRGAYL